MKKSLAYTVLFWLLIADLGTAGDFGVFEMLEGQGVELCEACFKALEALPSDLTGCERPYDAELGLSAPEWTELDPLKNLSLVKRVRLLVTPIEKEKIPGSIYDGDNFKREIKGLMRQGRVALFLAKIDIDNDGRPESVLKFRDGACVDPYDDFHVQFQPLVVLKDDRATIDRRKTDLVMQNPRKRKEVPVGSVWERIYDVFQYKGRVYFDKWDHRDEPNFDRETFLIYQAVGNNVTPLCKYQYHRRYRLENSGDKP